MFGYHTDKDPKAMFGYQTEQTLKAMFDDRKPNIFQIIVFINSIF